MKKIPSLFMRNYDGDRLVRDEVVPGCEWVLTGQGYPTVKWDGTSCLLQDGKYYRRYDAKHGKTPPPDFMPACDPDPKTGHWPGWVPVRHDASDKWHQIGYATCGPLPNGTYELIGIGVQGNPYDLNGTVLMKHGEHLLDDVPRDFQGLRDYLEGNTNIEGIVFHHSDGRACKLKRKDFGFSWPVKKELV